MNAQEEFSGSERLRVSVGSTGLRRSGGFVLEDYLPQLRGWSAARFYFEMKNRCSIVGMSMTIIESLVRQVTWQMNTPPGLETDPMAIFWRNRAEEMLHDMEHTFEDFISEVLQMLVYGFAPFEQVYKVRRGANSDLRLDSQYNDGLWGFRKIEVRAQETIYQWDWDDDGTLNGMWQVDPYAPRAHNSMPYLPIDKMVLFRTKSEKNNPEGLSMLRAAVADYHFLKRMQENEAIGIGKDLTGMVVMQVPREILATNASPDNKALRVQLEKMVQELQVDERMGALFPAEIDRDGNHTGFKLSLLGSGGQRQINPDATIRRYELRIAMSFLTEFQMIGQERVGAQALHQSKSNLFGVALTTILDNIASTFNRFCLARVMRLNNAPRQYWPKLKHGPVFTADLDKVGMYIHHLSQAGLLTPNKALEEKLLLDAGLPITPDYHDVRDDPASPTPAEASDRASGIMSQKQVETVLSVNEKLATGKISLRAAKALLASALGMHEDAAMRYLSVDETPTPASTTSVSP